MKMNKIAIAVGAAVMGLSGMAQAELSANIGATSNYLWRGVTQTMDGAAISGGVDYAHDSGFYAGTWASNVDFGSGGEELDLYAGFGGEASSIGYDVGVIYYAYPASSADDSDFTEVYGSLSFGPVTGGINYTVDKESGVDENDIYYYLSASTDLGDGWGVGGTIGHYDFDATGAADYSHAQLDVTKSVGDFGDFTFTLSNVFDQDKGGTSEEGLIPVVSWSKTF
jgi:uncharacterized protein (TIGR02001 family)